MDVLEINQGSHPQFFQFHALLLRARFRRRVGPPRFLASWWRALPQSHSYNYPSGISTSKDNNSTNAILKHKSSFLCLKMLNWSFQRLVYAYNYSM